MSKTTRSRGDSKTRWIARVKTTFAARAVVDEVDRPRYVQRRYGYLESAAMARAMERL